ncbi:MAG TPA: ABC transporter substrate-binding protein [Acetobacteraceae bacterium]|jgi:phospholipid transport system substrate-binding protein|nr:ABC transporter substrate-binding protein [Acetobacteraceae bacterium]
MIAIGFARRALLRGAWAVLLGGSAGCLVARAQTAGPVAPIEQLHQALLTIMRQGKATPFAQRATELTPTVERVFDLPFILRVSVGPAWSRLQPEEQRRLLDIFRQYTVATYVQAFDHYNGQRFIVSPQTRSLAGGAQVVHTEIVAPNGEKHTIDYVMRRAPNGAWQVTDVLADGTISQVAVRRSDFSSLLSRGGAAALEASLQRKTAALEGS